MNKLTETLEIIDETLAKHSAAVFFSGGVDSLLTLFLVRKRNKNIPVVTFGQDFTKGQWKQFENLIAEWNLTLYRFPPTQRYFVPNESSISLIDEYVLKGTEIPVIRDIENSNTGCAAQLDEKRHGGVVLGFDTIFTGTLGGDRHFATGKMKLGQSPSHIQGNLTFITPLYRWTKDEVTAALDEFGLTDKVIADTGELKACCECLVSKKKTVFCHLENKKIPAVQWDRQASILAFRTKYGFEGE